jgi:hypothetical protein
MISLHKTLATKVGVVLILNTQVNSSYPNFFSHTMLILGIVKGVN